MRLTDLRFLALKEWLVQFFNAEPDIDLICGDASFRRYFRISHQGQRYILADSPVQLVPIAPFIAIAQAYGTAGLHVPEILATCDKQGFVLQTDLGLDSLLAHLKLETVDGYYRQALSLLPIIASVTETELGPLANYDGEFVQRELDIFTQWLLGTHLELVLSSKEQQMLDSAFEHLKSSALAQPKVGMHRDFHSRNLILNKGELGVIDFQDAVLGPVTYDAVSLLRDCYVKWPKSIVTPLMEHHFQLCLAHNLLPETLDFNCYKAWFDLMGMQRHIKAAGIFARLQYRDNKPGYMADIPLTLSYLVEVGQDYPQLNAFSLWIENKILPLFNAKAKAEPLGHKA
jgi:aminoglycoside/choline kinase family phosphotransferase